MIVESDFNPIQHAGQERLILILLFSEFETSKCSGKKMRNESRSGNGFYFFGIERIQSQKPYKRAVNTPNPKVLNKSLTGHGRAV